MRINYTSIKEYWRKKHMFTRILENVRKTKPLIHNITNYVTVNDCANILLACGASPIMADDTAEVEEITQICNGLTINIGTLNHNTIPAMFLAGKRANELQHPVILDPVGAGASSLRTDTAKKLIEQVSCAVIRGNISEIKSLALGDHTTKGVDADIADTITNETLDSVIAFAKEFSERTGAIIAITGAIDIVANQNKAYVVHNGHHMMAKTTGTGCMLSTMITAFIVANRSTPLEAVAAGVCAMGLCGEKAYDRMQKIGGGNSSFRHYLIDEISLLDDAALQEGSKYELR